MRSDAHERSRSLLDRAMAGEISPEEQRWLDGHLAECPECSGYADLSARARRALNSIAFDVDPSAALRVHNTIVGRATELAAAQSRSLSPWTASALALLVAIAGSGVMWQAVGWLAGHWNVPRSAWQMGFAVFWLLPSLIAAALPLAHDWLTGDDSEGGRMR